MKRVTGLENLVEMGMIERNGFSGFRRKKIEGEHGKSFLMAF